MGGDARLLRPDTARGGQGPFHRDSAAAVAVTSEEIAADAAGLIEVDYEDLPTVFDPFEAMQEGAPVIHDDRPNNVAFTKHMEYGDVEKAFETAHHVSEISTASPKVDGSRGDAEGQETLSRNH